MEGSCSTDQRPQWAAVPVEEEEVTKKETMGAEQAGAFCDHLCVSVRKATRTHPTDISANVSPGSAVTELSSGLYGVSILTVGTCCLTIRAPE
jgi:hypothetical protein